MTSKKRRLEESSESAAAAEEKKDADGDVKMKDTEAASSKVAPGGTKTAKAEAADLKTPVKKRSGYASADEA